MMTVESSMPPTMGILRAAVRLKPFFSRESEMAPPRMPPRKPPRAGSTATKPTLRMDMPRDLTR
jgi:hypothetical protein